MKKMLYILLAVVGMTAANAQSVNVGVNGGVLTHKGINSSAVNSIVGVNEDFQLGIGNVSVDANLLKGKFVLGPSIKAYFYEADFYQKDLVLNNYALSVGPKVGADFGKFFFGSSLEFPFPDHRKNIFEIVSSNSAGFMISDKIGIKANFDYFVNKKLFNYAYSVSGGLIYKFN